MKENLDYKSIMKRENGFKKIIFNIFFALAVLFRVPLEIFFRKDMGHRYFSTHLTVLLGLVLFLLPFIFVGGFNLSYTFKHLSYLDWSKFLTYYFTWYVYLGFYTYFGIKRWKELKNGPSVFEGLRLTTSSGTLENYYARFIPKSLLYTARYCDIYGEPMPMFVVGLILSFISQPIGMFLMLCSIIYSISYMAAYHNGDTAIMDMLDDEIINEHAESVFMDEENIADSHGIQFYMKRPGSEKLKQKFAKKMFGNEDNKVPHIMN